MATRLPAAFVEFYIVWDDVGIVPYKTLSVTAKPCQLSQRESQVKRKECTQ